MGVADRVIPLIALAGLVAIAAALIELYFRRRRPRRGGPMPKCYVCHEPVEPYGDQWVHSHSLDFYCHTGDGSTAYPYPRAVADEVDRRYNERFPDSKTEEF